MEETLQQEKSFNRFSSFILKIVALLTMTIDHIGSMLIDYNIVPQVGDIFRIIGRLALPLFCFMIMEGVLHTKSFKKYALRLGIAALCISVVMIAVEYIPLFNSFSIRNEGNIFLDLLLGAVAVWCLRNKRWWVKLLALLPLGFAVGSSFASAYECVACGTEVWIIPFFLRTQYSFYGVLLIIGFYVADLLGSLYIKYATKDVFKNTNYERIAKNISALVVLGLINVAFYLIFTNLDYTLWAVINYMDVELQLFGTAAGIIILFYSGKRGYNAYWFKYGCYLYYAIHIAVISGLFAAFC